MKLSDIEFVQLLPQFMRSCKANIGLAAGMDEIIPGLTAGIKKLSTWDHLAELGESDLDALAWELNILWYDYGANVEIKRELAKNSDIVYMKLGTKWAVENVIKTYFGDGYITEWFEYEGIPGHFRVYSSNPSVSADKLVEFLNLMGKVKRASAKLDGIFITLTGEMPLCVGAGMHETSKELFEVGKAEDLTA